MLDGLTSVAEAQWLDGWTAGPTEHDGSGLPTATATPDLSLPTRRDA
jgi:hypothetical protein